MRKDVREQLQRDKAEEAKRVSRIAVRRGKRWTGLREARKALVCMGCGCVVAPSDAWITARVTYCPVCALSVPETPDPPLTEALTPEQARVEIDKLLKRTDGVIFSDHLIERVEERHFSDVDILNVLSAGIIKIRSWSEHYLEWAYRITGLVDGEEFALIAALGSDNVTVITAGLESPDAGVRSIAGSQEVSWLRPSGLLNKHQKRALLPRSERKTSSVPIAEIYARRALGISKQRSVPCDQCGAIINGTPFHLSNGRFCGDCVFRAGLAEEHRERSKGDYKDPEVPTWLVPEPRRPVGTELKVGQRIWDWVRREWREIVEIQNGHDVATAHSPCWLMWNPERAFRVKHGESFREADGRWRDRTIPKYAAPYFEATT